MHTLLRERREGAQGFAKVAIPIVLEGQGGNREMKIFVPIFTCLGLVAAGPSFTQSAADRCHVYLIDVKATQQFREKTDFDAFMKKVKARAGSDHESGGSGGDL